MDFALRHVSQYSGFSDALLLVLFWLSCVQRRLDLRRCSCLLRPFDLVSYTSCAKATGVLPTISSSFCFFGFLGVNLCSTNQAKPIFCWGPNSSLELIDKCSVSVGLGKGPRPLSHLSTLQNRELVCSQLPIQPYNCCTTVGLALPKDLCIMFDVWHAQTFSKELGFKEHILT